MKRRQFLKGMAVASALVLPTARPVFPQQPATPTLPSDPFANLPKVEFAVPDLAADASHRFFTREQYAALQKLTNILVPATPGNPGALDAGAPEFLDFLIGSSPPDRQQIYRVGLDKLNKEAGKQFKKPFAGVNAAQADTLLSPLRQPWSFEPPADPLAHFLQVAKQDVRNATENSREWNTAAGHDPDDAIGRYWHSFD